MAKVFIANLLHFIFIIFQNSKINSNLSKTIRMAHLSCVNPNCTYNFAAFILRTIGYIEANFTGNANDKGPHDRSITTSLGSSPENCWVREKKIETGFLSTKNLLRRNKLR